jgi:hypothetical protein
VGVSSPEEDRGRRKQMHRLQNLRVGVLYDQGEKFQLQEIKDKIGQK